MGLEDLVNRTGVPGPVWDAWMTLNVLHCQGLQTVSDFNLPNPIAEYVKDSEKTMFEGGFARSALGSVAKIKDFVTPTYRKIMDKKEQKNTAKVQKEMNKLKLETMKICMEIIDLDSKERACEEKFTQLAD